MTPAPLAELIALNCVRRSDVMSAFPDAPVRDDSTWTGRVVRGARTRLAASMRTVAAGIEPENVTEPQPTASQKSQLATPKRCN